MKKTTGKTITIDGLLAAGYKEFPPPSFKYAQRAFQKTVYAGDAKAYFLNVYYYAPSGVFTEDSFAADCNLYPVSCDEAWLSVDFHYVQSIDWLEEMAKTLYYTGLFTIDRHNN
jgi:hypothetical protein